MRFDMKRQIEILETLKKTLVQAPQRGYVQFAVPDLDIYLRGNAEVILERF